MLILPVNDGIVPSFVKLHMQRLLMQQLYCTKQSVSIAFGNLLKFLDEKSIKQKEEEKIMRKEN